MIVKMSLQSFTSQYGNSDRRLDLIKLLETEIKDIVERGLKCRVVIFGSFVRSCELIPNDIDVLLCVSTSSENERWQPISDAKDLHLFRNHVYALKRGDKVVMRKCLDPNEIINCFNENESKLGSDIRILESEILIEVTFGKING